MTVNLTREQEQRIEAVIHSGAYQSVENVGEAALTAVEQRAAPGFEVLWMPVDGEQALLREIDLPRAPQPVASFVDAVLGRAEPRCPGRACVRYVAAVEAAYRSAAEGRRIALD